MTCGSMKGFFQMFKQLEELLERFARQRHHLPKEAAMIFRRDLNAWMTEANNDQLVSLALGIATHVALVKSLASELKR